MIKVSHESPLALLEYSRTYNDYDYALVHLFETEPRYYQFFKDSLKLGRTVILDNSIFELGHAFQMDKYIEKILELSPTEFIIPDVLEDCDGTIASANKFYDCYVETINKSRENVKLPTTIGVVQGKTYGELVKCYVTLDKDVRADKLAISFDYSLYREMFPGPNKWVSYMMGRVMILNRLMADGIINKNKKHHLLGCAHPREFSFYAGKEYNWIDSLDTSSPIVHGIKEIPYDNRIGTWSKESTKLVDLLHVELDEVQLSCIKHNVGVFRSYLV